MPKLRIIIKKDFKLKIKAKIILILKIYNINFFILRLNYNKIIF